LRLAAIPDKSVMTVDAIQGMLDRNGLTATYADLGPDVFSGFSRWVAIRRKELGICRRFSPGWLKLEAVALWTQWLARKPALRYLLITASRSPGG